MSKCDSLCALNTSQLVYHLGVIVRKTVGVFAGYGAHSDEAEGPKLRAAIQKLLVSELHILGDQDLRPLPAQASPSTPQGSPPEPIAGAQVDKTEIQPSLLTKQQERDLRNKGRVVVPRQRLYAWLAEKCKRRDDSTHAAS